jgi:hypothetical protein
MMMPVRELTFVAGGLPNPTILRGMDENCSVRFEPPLTVIFGRLVGVAAASAVLVWKVGSRQDICGEVPRFLGQVLFEAGSIPSQRAKFGY